MALSAEKMLWYVRRLSRMGPAEIAHRVGEQGKRWFDRRLAWGWAAFEPFTGPVHGLPGLDFAAASPEIVARARATTARLRRGELAWLGLDWPNLGPEWPREIWTLDPVSGTHWPGAGAHGAGYRNSEGRGDVKFVWEPNRLQMLHPLALAAARGDSEAGRFAWAILEAWTEANPPYDGINWSSGIEAASRILSILALVQAVPPPDPAAEALLKRVLVGHARRLARFPSLHSSANNHRVSELGALIVLKACAPGLKIEGLGLNGLVRALEIEALRQFHSDGVGAEQSPTYAAYSLEWFVLAAVAAEFAGLAMSHAYRERAGLVADHLEWLADDAGRLPRLGDDDEGRVLALQLDSEQRYPSSVAALARRWLRQPCPPAERRDPALRDCVCPRLDEAHWTPPQGERNFEAGGVTVVRRQSRNGSIILNVDHGPLGFLSIAAHGHADALSVTLSWGEEQVFVDAGTYLYHSGGPLRDKLRGTGVHNTVQIETADQSRIIGPFAWADHARTSVLERVPGRVKAVCHGWRARYGISHERCIDWSVPGRVQIEDRLVGLPVRRLSWTSGLTLAPGCSATLDAHSARVVTPAGRCLRLNSAMGDWRAVETPYSGRFNHIVSTSRLELCGRLQEPAAQIISAFSWEYES